MAVIKEFTAKERKAWEKWVASRPPEVRALCEKLPPNRLYRHKPTGSRVTVSSYFENGTITMIVSGQYNRTLFEREVFGVPADELEECDLPDPKEELGAVMTQAEVEENMDMLRVKIRPDLFVMGPDGKAVRKN